MQVAQPMIQHAACREGCFLMVHSDDPHNPKWNWVRYKTVDTAASHIGEVLAVITIIQSIDGPYQVQWLLSVMHP